MVITRVGRDRSSEEVGERNGLDEFKEEGEGDWG